MFSPHGQHLQRVKKERVKKESDQIQMVFKWAMRTSLKQVQRVLLCAHSDRGCTLAAWSGA